MNLKNGLKNLKLWESIPDQAKWLLIQVSVTRVGPRQNNDIRESENGQPWKYWNYQNYSQNYLIAIFIHEIGNFPKIRQINVTINTNI